MTLMKFMFEVKKLGQKTPIFLQTKRVETQIYISIINNYGNSQYSPKRK
jgi:hypothetical protein